MVVNSFDADHSRTHVCYYTFIYTFPPPMAGGPLGEKEVSRTWREQVPDIRELEFSTIILPKHPNRAKPRPPWLSVPVVLFHIEMDGMRHKRRLDIPKVILHVLVSLDYVPHWMALLDKFQCNSLPVDVKCVKKGPHFSWKLETWGFVKAWLTPGGWWRWDNGPLCDLPTELSLRARVCYYCCPDSCLHVKPGRNSMEARGGVKTRIFRSAPNFVIDIP